MAGREGTPFGPYRMMRRLGAGTVGEVYLAEGPNGAGESSQVALKVLHGGADDTTVREILRQVQSAASLQQAHIIPLFGAAQHDNAVGIAMAFAPGGSLGDTLRAVRSDGGRKLALPLSNAVVARLILQLARALSAAHQAGLTHGDLKPSNIFVRTAPSGQPLAVAADFGQGIVTSAAVSAARVGGDRAAWAATQLTFTAPEQLRSDCVPASDQYALAAIAYLLLTGEPPLVGDATALLSALPSEPITPPSQANPAVSTQTEQVLLRALAKQPQQRYPTIEAFAQALDEALASPVGATSGMGVTQEFARLAASTPGMRRPDASGVRVYDRTGGSGVHGVPVEEPLKVPADASPRARRPLAIIAGVAVFCVLLACILGFRAFETSVGLPRIKLGNTFIGGSAPASTADTAQVAKARDAEAKLRAALSGTPVFSDDLTTNGQHWQTKDNAIFFAADGLHLRNTNAVEPIFADIPSSNGNVGDFAAQTDVTLVSGGVSDETGLRFFVRPDVQGRQQFYVYVITSEGRYEIRLYHQSRWTFVAGGYAASLKPGFGQTNTLAVVVHSSTGEALFFANGKFVTAQSLLPEGPSSGTTSLLVIHHGMEARFGHLRLYDLGA